MFPICISSHPDYTGTGFPGSWMTSILPFIEETNLYNLNDENLPIGDINNPNINTEVATTIVDTFLCPSDDNPGKLLGTRYQGDTPWGVTNYMANMGSIWAWGDVACHNDWPFGRGAGGDGILSQNNGLISYAIVEGDPAYVRANTRIRDMTDGTSNTIAIGEIVPKWRAHSAWYWFATISNTACPINYKSEAIRTDPARTLETDWLIGWTNNYGFYSRHPGGAQFGLGDGSVHLISENIDIATYRFLGNIQDGQVVGEF